MFSTQSDNFAPFFHIFDIIFDGVVFARFLSFIDMHNVLPHFYQRRGFCILVFLLQESLRIETSTFILSLSTGCLFFIRPFKMGLIMGIIRGGRVRGRAGGWAASSSLSGAYLQNYATYGYEISWVDKSPQAGVQCT